MFIDWAGNGDKYIGLQPLIRVWPGGGSAAAAVPAGARGNIDYDQIRTGARLGNGALIQMSGSASPVAGHVPIYDAQGNIVDSGSSLASAGLGSVTSVALSVPSDFSVSGSPITSSGTLSITGGVTKAGVQSQSYTYAADSGSANAYAVTLSPAPTIAAGSYVVFKATNANTTASTLAVNGGTATAIKKSGSTALASGDIAAGQIISVVYDGTNFQLIGGSGGSGDTTAQYVITATDATLTNAKVWPGLATHPDFPPASPGSLDDEFDAGSLSGSWTWVNQGSATATLTNGALLLKTPVESGTGIRWRYIYQTAPATPWEVQAKTVVHGNNYASFNSGFVLSDSGGKIVTFGLESNGNLGVLYYNSTTSFSGSGVGQSTPFATNSRAEYYFRAKDDGTNLTFWYSITGRAWIQFGQVSRTALLTSGPTRVGLAVDCENANSITLESDWFRRTL